MRRPGRSGRAAARRPALTGRALVLGGIAVLLVVVLAAPVTRYLASRASVGQAARQLHDDQAERTQLRDQKARWADPGYIQQQARARLQFAMPGDVVYTVVGAGERSTIARSVSHAHTHSAPGEPWNARLWDTVRAADRQ